MKKFFGPPNPLNSLIRPCNYSNVTNCLSDAGIFTAIVSHTIVMIHQNAASHYVRRRAEEHISYLTTNK